MLLYSYESSCLCLSIFNSLTLNYLNITITLTGTLVITMTTTSYPSQISPSPALSHLDQESLFPTLYLRPSHWWRTQQRVHRMWYYLWFQASTANLTVRPPWIRGNYIIEVAFRGFPGGSDRKESTCNVGDLGLISGLGRSPGEGHGNHSSVLAWRIPWTEEPGGL